ncbi:predicted protein [Nematostella vectensis]|uniref:Uncharacterized protein n=1 Tax=Nematostella vectensis TaxID=45351 RepID=A7S973_NEMVE|nr:predicted protein [Nematostella vectensis]|eukprot:XP_001631768.1 predicted protein [Nematostella vectensis]
MAETQAFTTNKQDKEGQVNGSQGVEIDIEGNHATETDPANPASGEPCYEDVYRTGNFGIMLGKVDIPIGKKWVIAQAMRSALLLVMTLAGTILLAEHYPIAVLRDLAVSFAWVATIFASMTTVEGVYFFWWIEKNQHPYAWLMVLRYTAVVSFVVNCLPSWLFACLIAGSNTEKFVGLSGTEVALVKGVWCGVIILEMLEGFLCWAFLWNPRWTTLSDCCKTCCIYRPGEEIAPGVPDPPSQQKMARMAVVALAVHNAIN